VKRSVIVLAALAVFLAVLPGLAQEAATITPELEAQMVALEDITRQLRELDGEPVERAFPTREETIAYLRETIDQQLPLDEADRYRDFYVALGLLEPAIDLRDVYLSLLSAQVAGFYDTDTQVMNVLPAQGELASELSLLEQIIYVHEYTHALQDQFFGLEQYLDDEEVVKHPDRALAAVALVEGDASAVMNVFAQEVITRNPLAVFQILGQGLQAGNLFLPPGTPAVLSRELIFPYEAGMQFVLKLYQDGGWEAVNAAYENPPVASEHILHPETYLAGQTPAAVSLADATAALGEGWTVRWDTTLGEWYLREHLRTQLSLSDAADAAQGWGGDRLHVYGNEASGALALALRLVWDTSADEAEFEEAYREFAVARFGGEGDGVCWSNAETALCMPDIDGETLIVYAPTVEQAQAIIAAQ